MLCTVGDLVEDVVAHLDGPIRLGADAPARITRHRGGSAANVAAASARLAGRSRFLGCIGDDAVGGRLATGLEVLGVDVRASREGRTGTIVAVVGEGGERTFITDRGVSSQFLLEMPGPLLDDVTVLHLPGYGLAAEPLASTLKMLAAVARSRGIPVSVDPSSLTIGNDLGVERYRTEIASLHPDVVLPNRDEADQLDLVERPIAPLTVVTAGGAPTVLLDGADRTDVPVANGTQGSLESFDTTGAGDAFVAGFLNAWIDGTSPSEAAVCGHVAAQRVVTGPGADHWDPS